MLLNIFWALVLCSGPVLSQSYEDKRCRCVCLIPAGIPNDTQSTKRQIFITNVPPDKCNCEVVVIPHVGIDTKDRWQELCPQCECKYEVRNTRVIMIVVILVLWLLTLLSSFMAFVMCLGPLLKIKKKPTPHWYRDTGSEETCRLLSPNNIED